MRWLRRSLLAGLALAVLGTLVTALVLWHQGYRVYIVHTGSMAPTYPVGSAVFERPARDGYHVGEVITFRHSENTDDVVTHRITRILPNGLINTKGDANRTPDVWNISPGQVQGSVIVGVKRLGYVLVFFQQPAGIAALALGVGSLVLLWSLFFPSEPLARPADDDEPPDRQVAATRPTRRKRIARHAAATS